jgi:hypothetical protein
VAAISLAIASVGKNNSSPCPLVGAEFQFLPCGCMPRISFYPISGMAKLIPGNKHKRFACDIWKPWFRAQLI